MVLKLNDNSSVADAAQVLGNFEQRLSENPAAHRFGDDALRLMREAFSSDDRTFPRRGCQTLNTKADGPTAELNEFTDFLAKLVRVGANTPEEVEAFSRLALFQLVRLLNQKPESVAGFSRLLLWLECNSELAILTHAATHLPPEQTRALASGMAGLPHNPETDSKPLTRGEVWTAVAWLKSVQFDGGEGAMGLLRTAVSPPLPLPAWHPSSSGGTEASVLSGRLAVPSRGSLLTAVTAFSGWLLLRQVTDCVLRTFLGYRANAEVLLSEQGLEIRESRTLLGRKLREQTTLLTMPQIKHLSREVRFARAGTYAGLAALGLGTVLGLRLFVDGLRVPGFSGPLLVLGLLVVIVGLGLDFALANWFDSSKSRCRFLVVTQSGNDLCLAGVEQTRADAILSELSTRLRSSDGART